MVLHDKKLIFIHVPKCGGISIENLLADTAGKVDNTDYDLCIGWCPTRKIHMQHATPRQLVDLELITKEQWDSYKTFVVIRNPWSKAVSDYFWLKSDLKLKGKFDAFLNETGDFKACAQSNLPNTRKDHFYPQSDYLRLEGLADYDWILKLENLSEGMTEVIESTGVGDGRVLEHKNKGTKVFSHYSHLFTKKTKNLHDIKYANDCTNLGFAFADKRSSMTAGDRLKRWKYG